MSKAYLFATLLSLAAIGQSTAAVLIFEEDFSTGTAGSEPSDAGWTRTDLYNQPADSNAGLAANNTGVNGATVETRDNLDFYLNGGASTRYTYLVEPSMEYFRDYYAIVQTRSSGDIPAEGRIYFTTELNALDAGGNPTESLVRPGVEATFTTTDDWTSYKIGFRVSSLATHLIGEPLYLHLESSGNSAGGASGATIAWDDIDVFRGVPEPGVVIQAAFGLLLIASYRKFRGAVITRQ